MKHRGIYIYTICIPTRIFQCSLGDIYTHTLPRRKYDGSKWDMQVIIDIISYSNGGIHKSLTINEMNYNHTHSKQSSNKNTPHHSQKDNENNSIVHE